jgi:replication factor A1
MAKVKDLTSNSRKISLIIKVIDIEPEREVTTKQGKKLRVADAKIADDSGAIKMTLWEDLIDDISPGDFLKIENAYVSEFLGALSVNLGKYGRHKILQPGSPDTSFTPNEEFAHESKPRPKSRPSAGSQGLIKIKELEKVTKGINVKFKVVRKDEPRGVNTKRGPATVCDFLVGDETGCILLTLWNDDLYDVALNSYYELMKGYTNSFRDVLKLNKGRYGTIKNISEEEAGFKEVNDSNNLSEMI